MVRKRNPENRGLPLRCRWNHGAIFYDVPKGQEHLWDGKRFFRLGKTVPEAYRELAKRQERKLNMKTIAELLDRYALEVIPHKAPRTIKNNTGQAMKLRKVFGDMPLDSLEP